MGPKMHQVGDRHEIRGDRTDANQLSTDLSSDLSIMLVAFFMRNSTTC